MSAPGRRRRPTSPIYPGWVGRWRPPGRDVLLAAGLLAVVLVEVWTVDVADLAPILAAALTVGCVGLTFRQVAPLTSTAVSITGALVVPALLGNEAATTLGWLMVCLAAAASCGYHARPPLAGMALVLGLIGVALAVEHGPMVSEILFGWILGGGAWFAGYALSTQASLTRLARDHADLVEDRSRWRADAALADERLRIARDIHDSLAHSVSVMQLHVGGVRRLLAPHQVRERAALEAAESAGREATAELHRILAVLRDGEGGGERSGVDLEATSLGQLPRLIGVATDAGLRVDHRERGRPRPLPHGLDQAAFRIIQEALTNVRRHSAARRVEVTVDYRPAELAIEVCDDGAGPQGGEPGHGLTGMRERAAAYGGTLVAGPGELGGFVVRACLPLPPSAKAESDAEDSGVNGRSRGFAAGGSEP